MIRNVVEKESMWLILLVLCLNDTMAKSGGYIEIRESIKSIKFKLIANTTC